MENKKNIEGQAKANIDVDAKAVITMVSLFNREQVIEFMKDKDKTQYKINLHCPNDFEYNEELLDKDKRYIIVDNEIIWYNL